MIRTFFRHEWESLKSLRRNGWMSVASASAVTITLVLVGIFLGVILNVQKLVTDIENDVNVNIFIATGTTEEQQATLKNELQAIPNVESITFSSRDEQYQRLVAAMGSEWQTIQGDANPLYDVFILETSTPSGEDRQETIKAVADKAGELDHVFRADYGGLTADRILSISRNIQLWGFGAAALLLLVAIFLISNTIRITIISRQREIQIMRLVGAKNSFIRWPFFFEGAWIGLLGSIAPVAMIVFGYPQVYNILNPSFLQSNYSLLTPNELVLPLAALLAIVGIVIGSLGSIISMGRFLKA